MDIQLSKREINILVYLLDIEDSVTTNQLGEMFNVSVRTIKYDLDNIRIWLNKKNHTLQSKRNKGIWLELPISERLTLKNEVLNVERFEFFPDQEIRVNRILLYLLLNKNFLTSQQLADKMEVSKNTIISDLDKVENLLVKHHVFLERKNRQGFAIRGNEDKTRLLMESITQKEITDYDIYQIMSHLISPQKKKQEIMRNPNTNFHKIFEIALKEMAHLIDESLLEQINYAEILSITLRVAIAVSRMQIGKTMGTYKLLANQNLLIRKKELPFLLMKEVFEYYELPILEDEYVYIYSDVFEEESQQNIMKLTEKIIEEVSKEIDFPFNENQQLMTNLFAHLSLRMTRKYKFINEYNPFVDDIKAKYPQLFRAIQKVSSIEIKTGSALLINDSFIAYIALHFLVAYEKERTEQSVVRIVYVCSTGLGVTNLIQQKVKEKVSNVEIVGFASILSAQEIIQEQDPDLVISIFPIEEVGRPFIKVSPLLSSKDMLAIENEVKKIVSTSKTNKVSRLIPRKKSIENQDLEEQNREMILKAYIIYEDLLNLLKNKLIKEYNEAFLLHVLLMVHRIVFNSQYENEGNVMQEILLEYKNIVKEIENIFANNNLAVNHAEITALLQYIREEKQCDIVNRS